MTVGARIKQAREAKKLTRPELAERSGVPYPTLAGLENGDQKESTKLHALATVLGVSVQWLATGKEGRGSPDAPAALTQQASQSVRPDFERMAAATRLLHDYLSLTPFDPELLFDPQMLEMAYEGVELLGPSMEPSNVLDFVKYMSKRMEERGGSVRPGEDQAARKATR